MEADEIRARLAARLREGVELRGLSILEMATRAGVARPHLYDVLEGRAAASVDYIARLATVLDIDPSALLASNPLTRRTKRLNRG